MTMPRLLSFVVLAMMMTSMLFAQVEKPRAPRQMKVTFASATLFQFSWNGDKLADRHNLYVIDRLKTPLWALRVESSKACRGVICTWSARPSDASKFQDGVRYYFSAFSYVTDVGSNEGGPVSFVYTRDAAPPSNAGGLPPLPPPPPATIPTASKRPPAPAPTPRPPTPGPRPPTNGNNGRGFNLPPANLPRGLGFGEWTPSTAQECSKEIHDSFWVLGPDGKVYHTWHPTSYTDPSGKTCYFGHEHGDDPKTSKTFGNEAIPFGYVNDVYMSSRSLATAREEDHVGHKVQVQDGIKSFFGNDPRARVVATCDALLKVHMGVHSNDAFVNNLHEVFAFVKCDDGRHMKIKYLNAFGTPGQCSIVDQCPPRVFETVRPDLNLLPFFPRDSPGGGGARKLIDRRCVEKYWLKAAGAGNTDWPGNNGEHWTIDHGRQFRRKNTNEIISFFLNPYLTVHDPIRFFDPSQRRPNSYPPLLVGYAVDQCFLAGNLRARGPECDALIQSGIRPPNVWNSTISPFKGTKRNFSPNRIMITNTTPVKTFYTNALMDSQSFSETPFTHSIQQYLNGNIGDTGADIFMVNKNWNAPGVHAPN